MLSYPSDLIDCNVIIRTMRIICKDTEIRLITRSAVTFILWTCRLAMSRRTSSRTSSLIFLVQIIILRIMCVFSRRSICSRCNKGSSASSFPSYNTDVKKICRHISHLVVFGINIFSVINRDGQDKRR